MTTSSTTDTPLTRPQAELVAYLWEYLLEHGYQPSYRDICEQFGFSSRNSVFGFFGALEKKGWVKITGEARALRLLRVPPDGRPFRGLRPVVEDSS